MAVAGWDRVLAHRAAQAAARSAIAAMASPASGVASGVAVASLVPLAVESWPLARGGVGGDGVAGHGGVQEAGPPPPPADFLEALCRPRTTARAVAGAAEGVEGANDHLAAVRACLLTLRGAEGDADAVRVALQGLVKVRLAGGGQGLGLYRALLRAAAAAARETLPTTPPPAAGAAEAFPQQLGSHTTGHAAQFPSTAAHASSGLESTFDQAYAEAVDYCVAEGYIPRFRPGDAVHVFDSDASRRLASDLMPSPAELALRAAFGHLF